MKVSGDGALKVTPETNRRYEIMEMHLFDIYASEEKALCGKDTSATERRGVNGYLEDRLWGNWVGTVCEGCKALAVPIAVKRSLELETEGLADEAEEYRRLADRLARETVPNRNSD